MQFFSSNEGTNSRNYSGAIRNLIAGVSLLTLLAVSGCDGNKNNNNNNTPRTAGAVFIGTNHNNTSNTAQPPNQIAMYNRAADGTLSFVNYFDTGGQGSGPGQRFAGDGLGASHSVWLSQDHVWLFATNAGSNNVTVFRVTNTGLTRTDLKPTGNGSTSQRFPNSVTQHNNLVYVLNSADQGSIMGYQLSSQGTLTPISNSLRLLNANQPRFAPDAVTNPTQISFSPDGSKLIVTIKDGPPAGAVADATPTGQGRILVFTMDSNGLPSSTFTQTEVSNHGPFGFSFDRSGNMLTALFVGGPNLTAAAGSFKINANGSMTPITPDVADTQLDTCWLENNGSYAYGANYTSGTISSFRIGADGSLSLLNAVAGTTDNPGNQQGSTPLDLGIDPNGQFLYNVLPGSGKVAAWRINADGSLTKIAEYSGLPKAVDGDHAPSDFSALGSPAGIAVL